MALSFHDLRTVLCGAGKSFPEAEVVGRSVIAGSSIKSATVGLDERRSIALYDKPRWRACCSRRLIGHIRARPHQGNLIGSNTIASRKGSPPVLQATISDRCRYPLRRCKMKSVSAGVSCHSPGVRVIHEVGAERNPHSTYLPCSAARSGKLDLSLCIRFLAGPLANGTSTVVNVNVVPR